MVTSGFIMELVLLLALVLLAFYAGKKIGKAAGEDEGLKLGKEIGRQLTSGKVETAEELSNIFGAKSIKFKVKDILQLKDKDGHSYSSIVSISLLGIFTEKGEILSAPLPEDKTEDIRWIITGSDLAVGAIYATKDGWIRPCV